MARKVVLGGPKMKERFLRSTAHFPTEAGQRCNAATVFANFHGSSGGKFSETGFQFPGKLHAPDYKASYLE